MSDRRTLLFLCGSMWPGSINGAVLRLAEELVADRFAVDWYDRLHQLPHYNPAHDCDPLDANVADLRRRIGEAAGILISTPQYARGLPGSLKNLLDWTIRTIEITGKRVAWINISGPKAADAHEDLRRSLYELGAAITWDACLDVPVYRDMIDESEAIADQGVRDQIAAALEVLIERVDVEVL